MKALITLFILLLPVRITYAQSIGDLIVGIGTVESPFGDSKSLHQTLASYMTSSFKNSGMLFSNSSGSKFKVDVDVTQIDGERIQINGIPMWVGEIQYDFRMFQVDSGNQFGAISISVKETGESESDLYRQSNKGLNAKKSVFNDFIKSSKEEILKYYSENMDRIISEAELSISQKKFDSGIQLLGQIPREISDYHKVSAMINKVFTAKIEYECDNLVSKYNVLKSQKRYDEALELLYELPSGSSCQLKTNELIENLQDEVCSIYIQNAESYFKFGELNGALEMLMGLENLTDNCVQKKEALETKIKKQLDAEAQRKWDQEQREYADKIKLANKKLDYEYNLVNLAIQKEAQLRAKKLEQMYQQSKDVAVLVSPTTEYVLYRSGNRNRGGGDPNRYLNAYYRHLLNN
jgi:tetratricopeptide (TPR) repeat protein